MPPTVPAGSRPVLDDEWHAIHELVSSSYWEIFTSFGLADRSIPLTLFYKAMAATVGLAEGEVRVAVFDLQPGAPPPKLQ